MDSPRSRGFRMGEVGDVRRNTKPGEILRLYEPVKRSCLRAAATSCGVAAIIPGMERPDCTCQIKRARRDTEHNLIVRAAVSRSHARDVPPEIARQLLDLQCHNIYSLPSTDRSCSNTRLRLWALIQGLHLPAVWPVRWAALIRVTPTDELPRMCMIASPCG